MSKTKPLLYTKISCQKQTWGQLHGSSLALAIAEYCAVTPGIKFIVAPDSLIAGQCLDELQFFLDASAQTNEILLFPDWETLPYDQFSPHQDIISERLTTLHRLQYSRNAIVLCSVSTLMHRLCPPDFLNHYAFILKEGQTFDRDGFSTQMQQAGYRYVNQVLEHGEYAMRGSIIDIFPMGNQNPFRIELFDNTIDSLRLFDAETQRTIDKISDITILPAREFPLNEHSISHFRQAFRKQFPGNPTRCPIYESISEKQFPAGIEYYLPLFFKKTATIFDYLPAKTKLLLIEDVSERAEQFWHELTHRYDQRRHDTTRPILSPATCFLTSTEFFTAAKPYEQLRCQHKPTSPKGAIINFAINPAPSLPIERLRPDPLAKLKHYLSQRDRRYLIVVQSAGRREVLLDLLKQQGISCKTQTTWLDFLNDDTPINILIGSLIEGSELLEQHIVILVEAQLFGEQATPQRRSSQKDVDPDLIFRDLVELSIGAPVVHLQFGVGRYQGLQTLTTSGTTNEFLVLTYAGEDKIYVPVTSLHLISRYTGLDSDNAPLHKLGSDVWTREKKKAIEKSHD